MRNRKRERKIVQKPSRMIVNVSEWPKQTNKRRNKQTNERFSCRVRPLTNHENGPNSKRKLFALKWPKVLLNPTAPLDIGGYLLAHYPCTGRNEVRGLKDILRRSITVGTCTECRPGRSVPHSAVALILNLTYREHNGEPLSRI